MKKLCSMIVVVFLLTNAQRQNVLIGFGVGLQSSLNETSDSDILKNSTQKITTHTISSTSVDDIQKEAIKKKKASLPKAKL